MDFSYNEIIDLTIPITSNMSVPPANQKTMPPVEFKLFREHSSSGIQVGYYASGIHAGTHLDAPRHIIDGGKNIDELNLDYFFGEAYCIDVSSVEPNQPVTAAMLEHAREKIKPGMMVFLYTGWSDKLFGTDEYWTDSPYLGEDAAQWLVDVGAKIAGFDFFQEVAAKNPHFDPNNFMVHKIILGNGVLNIEHLTNLASLKEQSFHCMAMPLKLIGSEGSPTRVVAFK